MEWILAAYKVPRRFASSGSEHEGARPAETVGYVLTSKSKAGSCGSLLGLRIGLELPMNDSYGASYKYPGPPSSGGIGPQMEARFMAS